MSEAAAVETEIVEAPPPVGKRMGRPGARTVGNADEERAAQSLMDWLRGLGDIGSDFQICIYRKEPRMWLGKSIEGYIERHNEKIDEEQIREMYGGGTYNVQLKLPDPKGTYQFFKSHVLRIAGDPKLKDSGPMANAPTNEAQAPVKQAMEVMVDQVRQANLRAERGGGGGGMDPSQMAGMIAAAQSPLLQTIDMLKGELAAARVDAQQARIQPPDPMRDRILDKVMADDSQRMETLRMAHASEIAQLKQSAVDLERSLRDRADRDQQRMLQQHESQTAVLRSSYEMTIMSLKESQAREMSSQTMMASTRDTVGTAEVKRLERENTELRLEVKELRAQKEKPLLTQIKELEELKSLLGDDKDDEGKPSWERMLDAVGNSKAALAMVSKLAGGDEKAAGGAPGQPQLPPPHVPFTGQDGNLYVHDGQGNVAPVQRPLKLKKRPRPAVAAAPPPPPPAPPPADAPADQQAAYEAERAAHEEAAKAHADAMMAQQASEIPRDMVQAAVVYLEGAFRGNQEPSVVAQSLRSQGLVPDSVFQFMRDQGVDALLEKVARLEASSPLATQAGRNWVRKVAKGLLGEA